MSLRTRSGLDIAIASTRPTFLPDKSICRRLPGFTTVDEYPIRSPLAVADFLAPIVSGRSFTEIGTRNGDIMGCLAHFARKVTAIELDANYCKKLRERGFEVVCRAVETVSATDLPAGDVYFWWPMWSPRQNEAWLRQLMQVHRDSGRRAVAYIAHDSHWAPDMQTLKRLTPHYRATNVTRIFFDEGDVAQAGTGRPGKWGVFHMARFELGGELPPRQGSGETLPPRYREGRAAESDWHKGFCDVAETGEGLQQDACEHAEKGSVPLGPAFGIRTRQQCVDFCFSRCKQCRYVSFSKELMDCSWYSRCDMSLLRHTVNGNAEQLPFETRAVFAATVPTTPSS